MKKLILLFITCAFVFCSCDDFLKDLIVDVTDPEPLPAGHRLWNIPTAVVTPHISGQYHLEETRRRIVGIFTSNLDKFLKGEELKNIVDFATGYRKL